MSTMPTVPPHYRGVTPAYVERNGPLTLLAKAAEAWMEMFTWIYGGMFTNKRTFTFMYDILDEITDFQDVVTCADLTPKVVMRWVRDMMAEGFDRELIQISLEYLHLFCDWAQGADFFIANPVAARSRWIPAAYEKRRAVVPAPIRAAAVEPDGGEARPVIIQGQGLPVIVLGRAKPPLSIPLYEAVEVLSRAWPARVPNALLEARRPHGAGRGARNNLRALRQSDPDWNAVIDPAGRPHRGWAIITPRPTTPTLSHSFPVSDRRSGAGTDGTLVGG